MKTESVRCGLIREGCATNSVILRRNSYLCVVGFVVFCTLWCG